ncbi:MAG TPA: DUF4340 domain-containing protein [Leptospiraceae bacterium]|nr:DUF4340 domain-containing protein [Leptospiraceae bacterium]HMW04795.1 DUF4340 domain-containing protein [Leptospiraceae bacterium]HMX32812.1 DUF4340 domain-containing protein [Leptospiraceae bacterium]HMY33537.1 DUF4340 domain-containing protein [Leptospiraceae bacterium]HMZ66801.1 DUF4340 domain-containing protein [Leptospiraceae bacterium]
MKSIFESYNKIFEFCMKNIALTLTAANIIFLLLILIVKDPFGLRISSYDQASPFLETKQTITKITIEKVKVADSSFELNKQSEEWILTAKGKTIPVDKDRIESLLKSIANARKYTIVSSSKDKSEEFGFNEDEIKIEMFSSNNSLGYFRLGSASTTDANSSYIKWKDSDDIYLIEENLRASTNRADFTYFLNKRVSPIGLTSEDLIGVTLKKNGNNFEIRKTNTWNLIAPKKGDLANEDMNTVLSKLSSVNAEDIVLDESTLKGIDPNPFELRVDYKSKDGIAKSYTLLSAGFDKKLNAYYIRKNNEPLIYKLSEYSIKSILEFKPETLVK